MCLPGALRGLSAGTDNEKHISEKKRGVREGGNELGGNQSNFPTFFSHKTPIRKNLLKFHPKQSK